MDNSLSGGAGDDTLVGGGGYDTLIGGTGTDSTGFDTTATYNLSTDTVSLKNSTLTLNGIEVITGSKAKTDSLAAEGDTDGIVINLTSGEVSNNSGAITTAFGFEHATGGSGNDTITGTIDTNSLSGGLGNDTLMGGANNDTLWGGAGQDSLVGGTGNDTFWIDASSDVVVEDVGGGTDIVQSSVSFTLADNIEELVLFGTGNSNGTGNTGANKLTGNAGNNSLNGSEGSDTMTGGLGNDVYVIDETTDIIIEGGNGGIDTARANISYTLSNNVENLILLGALNLDGKGTQINNNLTGNSGNNLLDGGAGLDTMSGGVGNDTYIVDNLSDTIIENTNEGADSVQSSVSYILGNHLENLALTGKQSALGTGNNLDNTIIGNAGANTLDGGNGNDTLMGGTGNDTYVLDNSSDVVIESSEEGTDTIIASFTYTLEDNFENLKTLGASDLNMTGNTLKNSIIGNSGDNILDGGQEADTMDGGAGDDTYIVDNANDIVIEKIANGNDTIQSSVSITLASNLENLLLTATGNLSGTGNDLNNSMTGNSGNNALNGGIGNDTLNGGDGNDTLTGAVGNDDYYVNSSLDIVTEALAQGVDMVYATSSYTLGANIENLTLSDDTSSSGTGNSLNNSIVAGSGNNTLNGSTGSDTLIGGEGDDTYIVDNQSDKIQEVSGQGDDNVISSVSYTLALHIESLALSGAAHINATGNTADNLLTGNDGNNSLNGMGGINTLLGGIGDDTYIINNVSDTVVENSGEGTDTILVGQSWELSENFENLILSGNGNFTGTGNTTNNQLTGNTGNNTLDGSSGADTMLGGLGDDLYRVDNSADVITENSSSGYDTIQTSTSYTMGSNLEQLILTGISAIDGTGNTGNNSITGNQGNNVLNGMSGSDTMTGGLGDDTYVVDHTGDVLIENIDEGHDTVLAGISRTLENTIENLTLSGTGNLNATGNTLNNYLTGNVGQNILDGISGDDTMVGGAGNDTYIVDSLLDSVTELSNEGTDTIQTSLSYTLGSNIENMLLTGTNTITANGNSLNNLLTGNTGDNTLDGAAGADTMTGGQGHDTYLVDNTGDVLSELTSQGVDTVQASVSYTLLSNIEQLALTGSANLSATGNTENNLILGNSGNNTLDGALGIDTLNGGAGDDTYVIDHLSDSIIESAGGGADTVQSSLSWTLAQDLEHLMLLGLGNINATGNTANNTLTGNNGNNSLDGAGGADTMLGGGGNDTYFADALGDLVTENTNEGTDMVYSTVTFSLGANIENLTLTGASALNGTGNSINNQLTGNTGDNILDGGAGADTLTGGLGNDQYTIDNAGDIVTELTGEGVDTVQSSVSYTLQANTETLTLTGSANLAGNGNSLDNTLYGNSGDNTLDGGIGADTLRGSLGNDTYILEAVSDVVYENAAEGNDTVQTAFTYILLGNFENLILSGTANISGTGEAGNNSLTGNIGNNTLDGGAGTDTLSGGQGDDFYIADVAGDIITELANEGLDTVQTAVAFTLAAEIENLILTGAGNINGTGNTSNNSLTGTTGTNSLTGGAGHDTLDGGTGIDTMVGGTGNDVYLVDVLTDIITENAAEGTDTVLTGVSYTLGTNVDNLTLTGVAAVNATGNTLDNVLIGNIAINSLDGGTGADTMTGGLGDDTYVVNNIGDVITENSGEGIDTVQSSVNYVLSNNLEYLLLTGGTNLTGTGNSLNNSLTGNTGNNILDGGLGVDTLTGGTGNDTFIVDNISDVTTEAAAAGTDDVLTSVSFTIALNVENMTLTGGSNINGTGNTTNNVITGNTGNNTLDGNTGNDTLVGGVGNDVYLLDVVTDVITENASEGTDTVLTAITYTLGNHVENLTLTGVAAVNATGNSLDNVLTGNIAINSLDGGGGADTMIGGLGNDIYVVNHGGDIITEYIGEGVDTVQSTADYVLTNDLENLVLTSTANLNGTGNSLNNSLTGNTGNNLLDGGIGVDTLTGGTGDDTYIVDNLSDVTTEAAAAGTDTILTSVSFTMAANVENMNLTGSSSINGIGNTSNNVITGNSGNNTLDGSTGIDTLIGGAGNDVYIVDVVTDIITENTSEGTDTVLTAITYTLGNNLENLTLTGVAAVNAIGNSLENILTGNTAINSLDGGGGADTMIGGLGNDIYVVNHTGDVITEYTSEGTDTVQASISYTLASTLENLTLLDVSNLNGTGNNSNNVIIGNTGNNILDGGTGADSLTGGTGDDIYLVDNLSDVVTEAAAAGIDLVQTGLSLTLAANVENLILTGSNNINGFGNTSNNSMTGNSGNNSLDGNTGNDTLVGGAGDDVYLVDVLTDVITENVSEGTDTVLTAISYTLGSNLEKLILTGAAVVNAIGNALNNVLTGNTAVNIMDGSIGADTMLGGLGNDTYVVDNVGDIITEYVGEGVDTVQSSADYVLANGLENLILTDTTNINGTGNSLNNSLTGNTGSNILDGGAGVDTLTGGTGDDTYIVDDISEIITEGAAAGTDLIQTNVSFTLAANVENMTLTGANHLNGTGNTSNNLMLGNSGNNSLDGNTGNDTLVGGAGDDVYLVDVLTDVITENVSEGTDTVLTAIAYTLGNNIENLVLTGVAVVNATGNNLDNVLTGNTAINIMNGGIGADTMIGGLGNDTYVVNHAGDVITEYVGEGTDLVQTGISYTLGSTLENLTLLDADNLNGTGNSASNSITGNTGNNVLDGGAGVDTLIGGTGNDIYMVDNVSDIITEAAASGTDLIQANLSFTIAANVENMTLTGSSNINGTGNTANNVITGNSGNNTLDGSTGIDTLVGGVGDDTYIVDSTTDTITENASEGTDTVQASVAYTLNTQVENLTLTGVSSIAATGNTMANTITGNTGNNTLDGGTGNDSLVGGAGNDSYINFSASTGADVINDLSGVSDVGNFSAFTTANATWSAVDGVDGDSFVDGLLIDFGSGFSVSISNYFSNTSLDDDLSTAGTGAIESLIFSDDANVTFTDVLALAP